MITDEERLAHAEDAIAMLREGDIGDWRDVDNAIELAGDKASAVAIPLASIIQTTRDRERRSKAAYVLFRMGPRALPALSAIIGFLDDGDPSFVGMMLNCLQSMGKEATPALERVRLCLESESQEIRADAARTLGTIGEVRTTDIEALVACVTKDEYQEPREAALVALYRLSQHDRNILTRVTGPEHALPIIKGLIGMVDRSIAPTFMSQAKALEDPDPNVRVAAIVVLNDLWISQSNEIADAENILGPALAKCLADPDPHLRKKAGVVLGMFADKGRWITPNTITPLLDALDDVDAGVRLTALSTLRLALPSLELQPLIALKLPRVKALLDDSWSFVRAYAALLLGQMGKDAKAAIPKLVDAARVQSDDDSDENRADNCNMLRALRSIQHPLPDPSPGVTYPVLCNHLQLAPGISLERLAFSIARAISETTDIPLIVEDLLESGHDLDIDGGIVMDWVTRVGEDRHFDIAFTMTVDQDEITSVIDLYARGVEGKGGELHFRESVRVLDADPYLFPYKFETPYDFARPLFFLTLRDALRDHRQPDPLDGVHALPKDLTDNLAEILDVGNRTVVVADVVTDASMPRLLAALALFGQGTITCLSSATSDPPAWLKARGIERFQPGALYVLNGHHASPITWAAPVNVRQALEQSDDVLHGRLMRLLPKPAIKNWACELTTLAAPYFRTRLIDAADLKKYPHAKNASKRTTLH